jgi:hypothetical protein
MIAQFKTICLEWSLYLQVGFIKAEGVLRQIVGPKPIHDHRQRGAAAHPTGENADAVRVSHMEADT